MISAQLSKLAQQNKWQAQPAEDMVYGEYNGYRFTAMDGIGFKAIFTPIAGISPEGLQALTNWLEENRKPLKLRNFEIVDNILCVRLHESWRPRTADQLEWILAQLSGMLDQFEMPKQACVICGKTAEKQGLLHGFFCALHPECQDLETVDFTRTVIVEPETEPEIEAVIEPAAEPEIITDVEPLADPDSNLPKQSL